MKYGGKVILSVCLSVNWGGGESLVSGPESLVKGPFRGQAEEGQVGLCSLVPSRGRDGGTSAQCGLSISHQPGLGYTPSAWTVPTPPPSGLDCTYPRTHSPGVRILRLPAGLSCYEMNLHHSVFLLSPQSCTRWKGKHKL